MSVPLGMRDERRDRGRKVPGIDFKLSKAGYSAGEAEDGINNGEALTLIYLFTIKSSCISSIAPTPLPQAEVRNYHRIHCVERLIYELPSQSLPNGTLPESLASVSGKHSPGSMNNAELVHYGGRPGLCNPSLRKYKLTERWGWETRYPSFLEQG